jgi:hypothetical protein
LLRKKVQFIFERELTILFYFSVEENNYAETVVSATSLYSAAEPSTISGQLPPLPPMPLLHPLGFNVSLLFHDLL